MKRLTLRTVVDAVHTLAGVVPVDLVALGAFEVTDSLDGFPWTWFVPFGHVRRHKGESFALGLCYATALEQQEHLGRTLINAFALVSHRTAGVARGFVIRSRAATYALLVAFVAVFIAARTGGAAALARAIAGLVRIWTACKRSSDLNAFNGKQSATH
jgi:hypothetical protein